jgi:hypothetical protein
MSIWSQRSAAIATEHEPWGFRAAIIVAILTGLLLWGGDLIFRANGLYGARTFVTEPIIEKRVVHGSRNSRKYRLFIQHRGERIFADVRAEDYRNVQLGQRVAFVVTAGRFSGWHVFLDRPGLKLDPGTTVVAFGLIVVSHALLVLALFFWFMRRAERA